MRDFPILKEKGKEINQDPHGGTDHYAPRLNNFYALGAKKGTNLE